MHIHTRKQFLRHLKQHNPGYYRSLRHKLDKLIPGSHFVLLSSTSDFNSVADRFANTAAIDCFYCPRYPQTHLWLSFYCKENAEEIITETLLTAV